VTRVRWRGRKWWESLAYRIRLLLIAGILVPAAMVLIGFGLAYLFRRELIDLAHWPSLQAVGTGLLTAVGTMGLVTVLYKSSKRFERALRESGDRVGQEALEMAGYPVMFVMVTMAGLGEEVLFRGGLQPTIGIIPAAVLFGFSHGGWRREMWAYVVVASLSGSILGLVYHLTGDLWIPIIAHAGHNALSTLLLGKRIDVKWEGAFPRVRLVSEVPENVAGAEEAAVMTWESPYPQRATARELGLVTGILPAGLQNDICDVPGVQVGHATVVAGDGALDPGLGPVRTGVTAILPHGGNLFAEKVPAAAFVLNGFGKSVGLAQIQELGTLETPILLTNTLSAFRAADALVSYMIGANPGIGITTGTVNPMVGECNDGYLSDIQGRHVTEAHVRTALANAAAGPVRQGAVGGGTGMVCYGFKGGIGSASRTVGDYTLGALVQANFGKRTDLMIAGVHVGQRLLEYPGEEGPEPSSVPPGSIMVVLATNAPLDARQLGRICRRGAMGLARTGASAGNGSGDFVVAFSTVNRVPHAAEEPLAAVQLLRDDSPDLDRLFLAAVEAVEEAVLNALFCASTVEGRDGRVVHALPVRRVLAWTQKG
jgi:D-aminopeptidase